MSTKLVEAADLSKLHQIGEFGLNELAAMKESIAKKLTIPQFNLFMYQVNRMGLDPSLGHAVPILYGQDVNIRIEYEGLKALAQDSGGYEGIYAQAVRENDEFSAESDDDGVITKVDFKAGKMPRGKVVGAFAVAKRTGFKDFIVICENDEFEKYVKKNPSFWKLDNGSIDPDMARKFVATRAAKGQFNIASVVEENTNESNGSVGTDSYVRKDITSEVTIDEPKTAVPAKTTKKADPPPAPKAEPEDSAALIASLKIQLNENLKKLGITVKEAKGAWIQDHAKFSDPANPTVDETQALVTLSEMELAEKQQSDDDLLP